MSALHLKPVSVLADTPEKAAMKVCPGVASIHNMHHLSVMQMLTSVTRKMVAVNISVRTPWELSCVAVVKVLPWVMMVPDV